MKQKIKIISTYIQIYWIKIFNIKYDKTKIPKGLYCYDPVEFPSDENKWVFTVKPCPYYIRLNDHKKACKYCGYIGLDICLNDQCKICGENEEFKED